MPYLQALRTRTPPIPPIPPFLPPQCSLLMCPFLLMSHLNVLFLKEVTCLVLVTFKEQVDKLNLVELAN